MTGPLLLALAAFISMTQERSPSAGDAASVGASGAAAETGPRVDLPNGLRASVGHEETGAPLSNLPTLRGWIDACGEVAGLEMDLRSPMRESVERGFESHRRALVGRRSRVWQREYEEVNALLDNSPGAAMQDRRVRDIVYSFTRSCIQESIRDIDAERDALIRALTESSSEDRAIERSAAAGQRLWRLRAIEYLRDPGPLPMPPQVFATLRMDARGVPTRPGREDSLSQLLSDDDAERNAALRALIETMPRAFSAPDDPPLQLRHVAAAIERFFEIDDRAIAAAAPLFDDPRRDWIRGALGQRYPHARAVIDAAIQLGRIADSCGRANPEIGRLVGETAETLLSQFDAMRAATRRGWRAQVVLAATPLHPEHAIYRNSMRSLAISSQQLALGLLSAIEAADVRADAAPERSATSLVRKAIEPLTGVMTDGQLTPLPLSADWPPRLAGDVRIDMLAP